MDTKLKDFLSKSSRLLSEDDLVEMAAELTAIPSFTGKETPLAEQGARPVLQVPGPRRLGSLRRRFTRTARPTDPI